LTPLSFRSRFDEIRKPLDFHQIEFAVPEGPTRELAWVRRSKPGYGGQLGEKGLDYRCAAVNLELGHILPGK
jgi:hypothetical protein